MVILETVEDIHAKYRKFFYLVEIISIIIFTIEYILRILVCTINRRYSAPISGRIKFIFTPYALVDLLSILPFYLPILIPFDLRFIRSVRLFRIIRIMKLGRYSESVSYIINVFKLKKEELYITYFILILLLIIFSSLIYFSEHVAQPNNFSSIPTSLWWGIMTLTTIGYGDIYPITVMGKVIAGMIAIIGIGMFALPAGIFASGFMEEMQRKNKNEKICPHCGKSLDKK